MKKNYSLILITCISFVLFACKKDKNDEPSNDINGTWELAETSSAMMPGITYHAQGNGNKISFSNDGYALYKDGQVWKEGSYTIVEDSTVERSVCLRDLNETFKHRVIFDADLSADKTFINISDGRLSLIRGCFAVDAGGKSVYRRTSNSYKH